MPINSMGFANKKWGVCGFTSSLYALYPHSTAIEKGKLSVQARVKTRVLAEIKTYLNMLMANGEAQHITDINAFCQSFKGYEGFTVADYVRRISDITSLKQGTDIGDFSIGMPPQTIEHYLRTVCGFRSAIYVRDPLGGLPVTGSTRNELIIGVNDSTGAMTMYGGLCHYMYQLNGKIYSWGKKFSSVAEAGKVGGDENWQVCVEIEIA